MEREAGGVSASREGSTAQPGLQERWGRNARSHAGNSFKALQGKLSSYYKDYNLFDLVSFPGSFMVLLWAPSFFQIAPLAPGSELLT